MRRIPVYFRGRAVAAYWILLALVVFSLPSSAQEASEVERALENLSKALQRDTSLDAATREALSDLVEAFKAERKDGVSVAPAGAPEVTREDVAPAVDQDLESRSPDDEGGRLAGLKDRLKFSGDFRLRHESNINQDIRKDRHRERIRLRVGGTYQIADELLFGARLVTGDPDDPQSANQTLGNVFDSLEISLDRVYLTYRPDWSTGSWVTVGKFAYPLIRNPVFGQLIWDNDVQPEGIVFGHAFEDLGRLEELRFVVSDFLVDERTLADDALALVLQGSGKIVIADAWTADVALSYFLYSGIDKVGFLGFAGSDSAGNALFDSTGNTIPDSFVSDFEIVNPMAAITWDGWKLPLTISGEYIKNFEANIAGDEGWAVGAALGDTKDRGDWRIYYQYQLVEQDAVFTPFVQDEFLFATNFKGHVFGAKYQLTQQIQLHARALAAERLEPRIAIGETDQTQWKIRGDFLVRF